MWTRVVGSCAAIDSWATACVLVYVELESEMWVAAWWFCILPVSGMGVFLSVECWAGEANVVQLVLLVVNMLVVDAWSAGVRGSLW
jgi:hypothetical protein